MCENVWKCADNPFSIYYSCLLTKAADASSSPHEARFFFNEVPWQNIAMYIINVYICIYIGLLLAGMIASNSVLILLISISFMLRFMTGFEVNNLRNDLQQTSSSVKGK